jgi:hypothetical protein
MATGRVDHGAGIVKILGMLFHIFLLKQKNFNPFVLPFLAILTVWKSVLQWKG